ncbi:hypothetical protein PN466_00920 [Roseofilum reptotaenium CS-1145]|uniref:Uncharacterized protein n=2 Tax=Roseofilum TaxID=1233426 RepID=A0A1L9QKX2_9CYAN|nr:hypothetical protein [Roseofilum reptotaenium CS-1145]OJJ18142.1 hypothetical protein BI308_22525 [Roseofilum reptotaenium AO1-A]
MMEMIKNENIEDKAIAADSWLEVGQVMYAGDPGGIMVNIITPTQPYCLSLTHMRIWINAPALGRRQYFRNS